MKIELRALADITPYARNPRINIGAVAMVAASIREFGWQQPIVVDGQGVIICGHTRLLAARQLGLTEIPVHVATNLTPAQTKAFRILDNKSHELSSWDLELLPLELHDLRGLDIDLATLGFTTDELNQLLAPPVNEGLYDPDLVPAPPDEATSQPGDLWVLGNHRLLVGDSARPEDVDRLLDGAVIHLANTDPPYNVRVEPRSNNAIAAGNSSFPAAAAAAAAAGAGADEEAAQAQGQTSAGLASAVLASLLVLLALSGRLRRGAIQCH